MNNPNVIAKDDGGMAAALAAMETHLEAMLRAGSIAEGINEQIARGYQAASSTLFQSKVQDWITQYRNVMNSFQQLADNTSSVNNMFNQAEEETGVLGGSWNLT